MNQYAFQYDPAFSQPEVEPLKLREMTDSGVVILCPAPDAADLIFDVLAEVKEITRRPFGTVGMNRYDPHAVRWTREPRRSLFFREHRWSTDEIVSLVSSVWEEVGRDWMPVPTEAPTPPNPAPSSGGEWNELRSLEWMADQMRISPRLLYKRLERDSHGYQYASRESTYFDLENWEQGAGLEDAHDTLTAIDDLMVIYGFDRVCALTNLDLIREERRERRRRKIERDHMDWVDRSRGNR